VVIGGRTAVWAPVPDLAAVVVLDDTDEALEDERAPTWNARDVAVERARRVGAAVRIATPAPTVEALEVLGAPVAGRPPRWPRFTVVDPRDEEPGQCSSTALAGHVASVRCGHLRPQPAPGTAAAFVACGGGAASRVAPPCSGGYGTGAAWLVCWCGITRTSASRVTAPVSAR
jgi:hypothetical protein